MAGISGSKTFGSYVRKKTKQKKKEKIKSSHEGLGLILEEVEELKKEVFEKKKRQSKKRIFQELVDIGSLCQRFAEDVCQ